MSIMIPEITAVRALHKEPRDTIIPDETAKAIQRIHECLRMGMDSQGWSRVDWRSRPGGGTGRPTGGSGGSHGPVGSQYRGFGSSRGATGTGSPSITMNRSGTTGVTNAPQQRPQPVKYVSRFKSDSTKIDDTILNTLILGKLNKFSPANYDEIKGFMCQILDSGETDFLKEFMKLVFQKAASEEIFCPLYARLLSELSDKYKILLDEMVVLYKEYMEIFCDINESDVKNYDEFVTRTSEKKYRLGYSQFLAELVKYNVLDSDLLIKTIRMISAQIPKVACDSELNKVGEEYSDCLLRIVYALASSNDKACCNICTQMKEELSPQIHPLTVKTPDNKLTMKARFALLDIYEKLQKK